MMPEDIIIEPVITEKSNDELQGGKYTFKVSKKATKVDIARAVEKLFDVRVLNVNTVTVRGKQKRKNHGIGDADPVAINKRRKVRQEPVP